MALGSKKHREDLSLVLHLAPHTFQVSGDQEVLRLAVSLCCLQIYNPKILYNC